jgi:hypothetical protein
MQFLQPSISLGATSPAEFYCNKISMQKGMCYASPEVPLDDRLTTKLDQANIKKILLL